MIIDIKMICQVHDEIKLTQLSNMLAYHTSVQFVHDEIKLTQLSNLVKRTQLV